MMPTLQLHAFRKKACLNFRPTPLTPTSLSGKSSSANPAPNHLGAEEFILSNALFSEERDDTTVVSTLTVEIKSTDSGPLLTPITEPPTPKPGDTYTGAGPHGLPQDGVGWKNHIARKRYQNPGVDHNAINGQDRCATAITTSGTSYSSFGQAILRSCLILVFVDDC
jgi:hypothetical protein